jgi:hypothetical protein
MKIKRFPIYMGYGYGYGYGHGYGLGSSQYTSICTGDN